MIGQCITCAFAKATVCWQYIADHCKQVLTLEIIFFCIVIIVWKVELDLPADMSLIIPNARAKCFHMSATLCRLVTDRDCLGSQTLADHMETKVKFLELYFVKLSLGLMSDIDSVS